MSKSFRSRLNNNYDVIELHYNCLNIISKDYWFCRIWVKDWINEGMKGNKMYGSSRGKNKFEAYRKAK